MGETKSMSALRYAFPKTVPVMAGYLVLGTAYGILMNVNGYGIWWSVLISIFVYAGSLQYLGITFFAAAVNPWYAFFMSLMLNARHLFYGLSMLDKYKDAGKLKPYLIFALTDETFSVLCNEEVPEGINKYRVYFFASLLDHLYWVTGALIGSLAGGLIRFDTAGMDFALTALFVVIFVDQWKSGQGHKAALAGVGASALCVAVFGQSVFIVPAMILILTIITIWYFKEKREGERS
ncbi:MAG: AzlC family ABC transporter permease [Lacrimispora sp.]|uniref:AzlC family ABC transporter permease n=1 Tax=Lacrimispora sp. TaxID=2719234 RepID=UPI0039E673DD